MQPAIASPLLVEARLFPPRLLTKGCPSILSAALRTTDGVKALSNLSVLVGPGVRSGVCAYLFIAEISWISYIYNLRYDQAAHGPVAPKTAGKRFP